MVCGMAQADSTFSTFFKTPGAVRVRVQEILPGAAPAAVLAFWGWLAISAVHLREEVARNSENIVRNTESIRRIEARLDSMDSRLDSMDARLVAIQSTLAVLVGRRGGEAAPRQ